MCVVRHDRTTSEVMDEILILYKVRAICTLLYALRREMLVILKLWK